MRANAVLADIQREMDAQTERDANREQKLTDEIREWIAGGAVGERPMAGIARISLKKSSGSAALLMVTR